MARRSDDEEYDLPDEPIEDEYEYVDEPVRVGLPGWAVGLLMTLAALVGFAFPLLTGITRETIFPPPVEESAPIQSTVCSGTANIRANQALTADVVDTLNYGDAISGDVSGAWVKLDEGRYISVRVLCDLVPGDAAAATEDQVGQTAAAPAAPEDQAGETAARDDDTTGETAERPEGTFSASGTGPATLDLPADVRSGIIRIQHTGDGQLSVTGQGNEEPTSPSLTVNGDFSGTDVFGVGDTETRALVVTGSGQWSVIISPLDTVPTMQQAIAGESTAAFFLGPEDGTWVFRPTAQMRLVQYQPDGESSTATIEGPSSVELVGEDSYLVVYTGGPWTAEVAPADAPAGDQDTSTQAP